MEHIISQIINRVLYVHIPEICETIYGRNSSLPS
jgi:hypothetical protein